ncbi:31262_t:CDS:1, partial [Racocetra persica]
TSKFIYNNNEIDNMQIDKVDYLGLEFDWIKSDNCQYITEHFSPWL